MVVLLPDSGRGYLSKLYNDAWMADHGFLQAAGPTVARVLAQKGEEIPPLVHVHPDETVRAAIALLREYEISQVPVVKAEPPLSLAEVVGSVTDRALLERALSDPGVIDNPVSTVMDAPLAHHRHRGDHRPGGGPAARAPGRFGPGPRPPYGHPDPLGPPRLPGPPVTGRPVTGPPAPGL